MTHLGLDRVMSALDDVAAELPRFQVVVTSHPTGQPWIIHPDQPIIYLHGDATPEAWSVALLDAVAALRTREHLPAMRPRLHLVPPLADPAVYDFGGNAVPFTGTDGR